ncbi:MAG: hypothetical protein WC326_08330 [Candidatus Delongbacteria bacterium]
MPDPVFYAGDLVHYHPVIGGPHTGLVYRVKSTSELFDGQKAAWLISKTGCVSFDALSLVRRATPDDRFSAWLNMMRIRSANPSQRAHFDAWERLQDLAADQAELIAGQAKALESAQTPGESLQARVLPWVLEAFGPDVLADKTERGDRLLEEVLELLQSGHYDSTRVRHIVHHVYSRREGEPAQEVGGVMVTLAAYCLAHGLDMHATGETELARIWTCIEQIRVKQATVKAGIVPVPIEAPPFELTPPPPGPAPEIGLDANEEADRG